MSPPNAVNAILYDLDERLQRVKPLCYPPANLIRGKLSFTGVVSVTLNFHPQGRNVNDVTNEGKSRRPGSHCDSIR